jgi:NAD(P)-dependent dehydrogenase (short-subunit alcohol dehydrogenase family)
MDIAFDLDRFIRERVTRRERSLLADDFVRFDGDLHARIDGRRALVIGGAGSIGSHYIKALLRFNVAKLCVVDTSENGLTELVRDLRSGGVASLPADFITYPVSFGDPVFAKLFHAHGPFDIVANFAAHKHVRSEKDPFSIEAMVENNLLRARGLLDLLLERPPEHFFCVSTDKAANPVNLMGASKKLMEEMILAYAGHMPVTTARFANVAFSNGSLPLGFLERVSKRQPWSCPLGIRRFFVSPTEAGELCLLASILGNSGDILFPKLDEARDMIPFERVAVDLLHALGLESDVCHSEDEAREKMARLRADGSLSNSPRGTIRWPVYFFDSDTSGEKPYEEFYTPGEDLDLTRFVNLGVVTNAPRRSLAEIDGVFAALRACFDRPRVTKAELVAVFKAHLPNFAHIETGKGLDQKM